MFHHISLTFYFSAETSSPPSLRFVSAENIEVDQAIPNALLMKNQTHQMEDISNDSDSPVVVEATEVNYEHDKKKSPKPKVLLCGLEEEDEEEVVPPLTPLGYFLSYTCQFLELSEKYVPAPLQLSLWLLINRIQSAFKCHRSQQKKIPNLKTRYMWREPLVH